MVPESKDWEQLKGCRRVFFLNFLRTFFACQGEQPSFAIGAEHGTHHVIGPYYAFIAHVAQPYCLQRISAWLGVLYDPQEKETKSLLRA